MIVFRFEYKGKQNNFHLEPSADRFFVVPMACLVGTLLKLNHYHRLPIWRTRAQFSAADDIF